GLGLRAMGDRVRSEPGPAVCPAAQAAVSEVSLVHATDRPGRSADHRSVLRSQIPDDQFLFLLELRGAGRAAAPDGAVRGGACPACPVRYEPRGAGTALLEFPRGVGWGACHSCVAFAVEPLPDDQGRAAHRPDVFDLCRRCDFTADTGHILLRSSLPNPCAGRALWTGPL